MIKAVEFIGILSKLNYRLFTAIFLTLLFPTLYTTFRIYLISDIPNEWGFNIASQIAWLNILYEILQEGIILPLFFVLGSVASHSPSYYRKVRELLLIIFPLYFLISLFLWYFTESLVIFLNQTPSLVADTVAYIKLESIAIPFRVISDIVLIALITLSAKKSIYLFILLQLAIRLFCDFLFIGEGGLNLGILGIAYSSILIYVLTSTIGLFILFSGSKSLFPIASSSSIEGIHKRVWFRVSLLSGLESGVRNVAFIVMILKLVNEIGESGTLWLSNSFIWGWLLLPILSLGTLIKRDVGVHDGYIGIRFPAYFLFTFICVLFWLLTIPFWHLFFYYVMGIEDSVSVFDLTCLLLIFYIIFAFNNVYDSYFYGMGRTDLMLYQSLLVNCVYYLCAFFLYQFGFFIPTLYSIALLFGFGILLDFLATFVLFRLAGYPRR